MALMLDYYYGGESERSPFYRLPKALLDYGLSPESMILYSMLVDRTAVSGRNGWTDDRGRVFIYFTLREVQDRLGCGHNRATALLRELERAGFIERKRQGLGKPAKIFVKNFDAYEQRRRGQNGCAENTAADTQSASSFTPKEAVHSASGGHSAAPDKGIQDCPEQAGNYHNRNKTEKNHIHPISSPPPCRGGKPGLDAKRMGRIREKLRENIDYEGLVREHPENAGIYDGYVEIMTAACCPPGETVRISGQEIPVLRVRQRLARLGPEHITYVHDCINQTQRPIINMRAYILAALYNAPDTMEQYYDTLVRRDFEEVRYI